MTIFHIFIFFSLLCQYTLRPFDQLIIARSCRRRHQFQLRPSLRQRPVRFQLIIALVVLQLSQLRLLDCVDPISTFIRRQLILDVAPSPLSQREVVSCVKAHHQSRSQGQVDCSLVKVVAATVPASSFAMIVDPVMSQVQVTVQLSVDVFPIVMVTNLVVQCLLIVARASLLAVDVAATNHPVENIVESVMA